MAFFLVIPLPWSFPIARRAMLLTPEELHSNLDRLTRNLISVRCCVPSTDRKRSSHGAASAMPLCHTTGEVGLLGALGSGALLSSLQRGVTPRSVDQILDGADEICFYLGSAAFPDNDYGFLFRSELADRFRGRASATPFDSGGCIRRYFPDLSEAGCLAHVRKHTLPVPENRGYLGDMLGSHFEDTVAYLAGRPFACPSCGRAMDDPHGMPDYEHALVRMHEVRIPGRVDLAHPLLLAVFAPRGNVKPELAPLVSSGVRLVPYENSDGKDRTRALRRASIDYILTHLLN